MPAQVFVSYDHDDRDWRHRFEEALGSGQYAKQFKLWFDSHDIRTGSNWSAEIEGALGASSIALLLVSPNFLRSEYIAETELPRILARHKEGTMSIFWVPVESVPRELLESAELDPIQAVRPPSAPLCDLDSNGRERALDEIGVQLIREVRLRPVRDDLWPKVEEVLSGRGIVLEKPLATGDYSIFYKATQHDGHVAVKALIPSARLGWLAEDFVKRAKLVQTVSNSTAISIRAILDERHPYCVVMDYVEAPTLATRLKDGESLSHAMVADILAQLARLGGHLHAIDGEPLLGAIRPSHVHYDDAKKKAFISLLPIAPETLDSGRRDATLLLDWDALPYLSPERYYGHAIDRRVDQYHLGLLALELLHGKVPVPVKLLPDLDTKAKFFAAPREYFSEDLRRNHPAFAFVLARMLEPEPKNRWASMSDGADLHHALQQLAAGELPDAVRAHADQQYNGTLSGNTDFFRAFYDKLFARSPEVKGLFDGRGVSMEAQYAKLDDAMSNILNFSPDRRTSTIRPQVKKHRELNLEPKHFDAFRDAFLDSLPDVHITDHYSRDAWRALLDPALAYMRTQVVGTPAEVARA